MKTDVEIARERHLLRIDEIARNVDMPTDELEHYGKYMAIRRLRTVT